MQYRVMPKNGDKISVLGYGCMRFPTRAGLIDKEKALAQVRRAIDAGVNYLDTAYPYHAGASETFLGDYVLKDGYREKVRLATKLPVYLVSKPEDMDKYLNKQLERLRTDHIDYYLLHGLDGTMWKKMVSLGVLEFMDRIRASGKVTHMGFSFHGTREAFFEIMDAYDWDFTQIQFNILDENFQAGLAGLNYATEKGVGVIVMEPLRGGLLVGRIPEEVQKLWDKAPVRRSPADWAMRWIYNHPGVICVLSGMNQDAHIDENIRVASESLPGTLSAEELAIINDVRETYQRLLPIGCTGCRYCIECPVNIDIPYAFQTYNTSKMFGGMAAKGMYVGHVGVSGDKPHWTHTCIDCGKCEKRCPQGIEIRKEFKKVQKELEGPGVRVLAKMLRPLMLRGTKKS